MAHRPLVLTLAAGAALTASTGLIGCSGKTSTSTPPPGATPSGEEADDAAGEPADDAGDETLAEPVVPSEPDPMPPMTNPPPQPVRGPDVLARMATRDPSKAEWDEVGSPHPPGATNPPSPVLIVTPDGDCFKRWEGGMIPTGGDRVEVVSADGSTTAINCPPDRAKQTYEAWIAAGKPDPTQPGFPPEDF